MDRIDTPFVLLLLLLTIVSGAACYALLVVRLAALV
jgi:hypothetical protein